MVRKSQSQSVVRAKSSRPSRGKRDTAGYRDRVYDIVRRIPVGHVMTYGQIAIILGEGYTPRTIGYVMHASEDENVPWQRVINSQGACSTGRIILPSDMQQRILENEGIAFDVHGRCDLNRYRWLADDEDTQQSDIRAENPPSLFRRRTSRTVKPEVKKVRAGGSKRKR